MTCHNQKASILATLKESAASLVFVLFVYAVMGGLIAALFNGKLPLMNSGF